MKKSALLANLLVSSTLFWGVPALEANDMISAPVDMTSYCHLQFPAIRSDTLAWERPVLDPASGNVIDFYGPCGYDPAGPDEVRAQRQLDLRGYFGDGE
jgi:hypothetical protein